MNWCGGLLMKSVVVKCKCLFMGLLVLTVVVAIAIANTYMLWSLILPVVFFLYCFLVFCFVLFLSGRLIVICSCVSVCVHYILTNNKLEI